jgi:hypothetical protein
MKNPWYWLRGAWLALGLVLLFKEGGDSVREGAEELFKHFMEGA